MTAGGGTSMSTTEMTSFSILDKGWRRWRLESGVKTWRPKPGRHNRLVLTRAFASRSRTEYNEIAQREGRPTNNEDFDYRGAPRPELACLSLPGDPAMKGWRYGPPPSKTSRDLDTQSDVKTEDCVKEEGLVKGEVVVKKEDDLVENL